MRKKPVCADFIIAALRTIRAEPKNLLPRTAAGVGLHRLYEIASEAYTETEFRTGLDKLLRDGTLVLVSRVSDVVRRQGNDEDVDYGVFRLEKRSSVPQNALLGTKQWYEPYDEHGSFCRNLRELKSGEKYRASSNIRLYVRADGLPPKIAGLERKKPSRAAQIIEQMAKTKR